MWVVLKGGHVAAIAQDQFDADLIAVRCWNEEDADVVFHGMRAVMFEREWAKATKIGPTLSDYPWRVTAPASVVGSWLALEVDCIDYEKFKPTVDEDAVGGRARHDALLKMFFAGWDLLRDKPYTGVKRKQYGLHRKHKGVVRVESFKDKPLATFRSGQW